MGSIVDTISASDFQSLNIYSGAKITLIELAFLSKVFVLHEHVCNWFDENPAMTLQDIKETKRYGWTHGHTHRRTTEGGGSPLFSPK